MRNSSSVTGTRPLRATYASDPEDGVIEGVQLQATADAASNAPPQRDELGLVIDDFMRAAEDGEAQDSHGHRYTPEGLWELYTSLGHVKSELGTTRIQAIRRWHVQGMLYELDRAGLSPDRLTSVVESLHLLYRHAIERGLVEDNPVIWLNIPQHAQEPLPEPSPPRARETVGQETVRLPPAQAPPQGPDPEVAQAPPPAQTYAPLETTTPTPTPTQAMLALGSRVLSWTVRVILTIFVLVAIVLIVQFA
jgi:cell division septation protein DedD